MTGPFAFLHENDTQQTPSPFAFLHEKDEGALDYLGNLTHNFGLAVAAQGYNTNDPVITPMADFMFRNNPQERQQIQLMREQLKQANMKGGDTWKVLQDKLQPSNLYNSFKDSIGNLFTNGVDAGGMVSGLAKGLVQAPGSILEAGTGLNLGDDFARAMTPEERAQKIKDAAAVLVTGAVTATARFAMLKGMESLASKVPAGASADVAANVIQKGGKLGLLGKQLVRSASLGAAEGAIAGGTFGAVSGLGDEDQASKIISGMMFAPIGAISEIIGAKVKGGDEISKIQEKAGNLFAMRQLQYSPDKNLFEVTKGMEAIATSDDLAMAVAKGQLDVTGSRALITNITKGNLTKISDLVAKNENVDMEFHIKTNQDGTFDFLALSDDTPKNDISIWKQTGYLPNEVVSFNGKDYLFHHGSGDIANIIDPISRKVTQTSLSNLTRNTEFNLDDGTVTINSPLTLKGKLLAVNRANPQGVSGGPGDYHINLSEIKNPYHNENTSALDNVATGKPITFIGMRQSRGQGIIGNGKFYALSPEHVMGYAPRAYEGYSTEIIKGLKNESSGTPKLGSLTSAPGRETIPGILDNNLSVNRLTFNNPFVFEGKHYSFSKDVANFYEKYVTSPSAPPWAIKDLAKSGAVSDLGVTWGSIFTKEEMAGIKEARALEQKPVGVPTSKYMAANDSPLLRDYKKMQDAYHQYDIGVTKLSDYNKIHEEFLSKYTQQEIMDAEYAMKPVAGKTHSESHYAIIDRIVAKAMKRNGYDGFIYRSGGIHNSEIVDINERGVFNRLDQTVPVTGKASNILDAQKFVDKLYDEFKQDNKWTEPADQELLHTTGEAKTSSAPFEQAFNNFAKEKGFLPEEIPNLRRSFEQRIHGEILDNLPNEEKVLYSRLQNEIANKQTETFNNTSNSLKESAVRNGMYFDQHDAGVINLRDMESNKSLGIFHSTKDAQDFITKSGQAKGINLDGNSILPPTGSGGGHLPDNVGPQSSPATNVSWLDKKHALLSTNLQWITANPSLFKDFDIMWGTTLFAKVFDKVESSYRKFEGAINTNVLKPLQDIVAPLIKAKITEGRLEQIGNYLEATSIKEFLQNGEYGKKPVTPLGIAAANEIQKSDITNAYNYFHALRDVDPKNIKKINALKQQFNIGPNEENTLAILDAIGRQPKELGTIYAAVKLARLQQNPELALTRAEYAKKFNFTPTELQAATNIDAWYKKQADIAGIPEEGRLANYMTHARLYEKGNIGDTLAQLANSEKDKQFYAGMVRTGELSVYEQNPINGALRYGNALYRTMHLNPAISDAVKELKLQVYGDKIKDIEPKVPIGAGDKVINDANRFFNDVQQRRSIGDNYANASVDAMNNHLGVIPDANVRKTWVNTINKFITASAQAGRPFVGIRNFWQNGTMYFQKWGLDETRKILAAGAKANVEKMKADGQIQGYSPFNIGSPVDEAQSQLERVGSSLRNTLDKTTNIGMKLSGQQAINERFAAGAYQTTWSNVAEMARKLVDKKFGDDLTNLSTYEKAYHTLQLERYSDPVKVEFDRLVKSSKFDEAAHFLANANIQETWGTYGNANSPSGWNTNIGRLVGKFGSWAANHRDFVVSLASRGTRAQRLQSLGRFALTEGAIAATAATLGVNLSGFYSLPALLFNGGPSTQLFFTAMNAVFGRGQEQNNAIDKVLKLLPYDFQKDEFHRSIVVPFSYGIGDLVDGLDMASNGDVAGGLMQIGGIKPQSEKYQPSEWESEIGNIIGAK